MKRGTWSVLVLAVNVVVTGPVVGVVDEAEAGGNFCVAGVVEDVGPGEAGERWRRGGRLRPSRGGCRVRSADDR